MIDSPRNISAKRPAAGAAPRLREKRLVRTIVVEPATHSTSSSVSIRALNLQEAADFYVDLLGAKPITTRLIPRLTRVSLHLLEYVRSASRP